jgi:hypothetical protein
LSTSMSSKSSAEAREGSMYPRGSTFAYGPPSAYQRP